MISISRFEPVSAGGAAKSVKLLVFLIAVLVATSSASGQAFVNGSVVGTVTDTSGGGIPGATVTLTNIGTNVTTTMVTDDAGMYRFPNLPPGTYTVTAEMAGFQRLQREALQLHVNNTLRIDFSLPVGEVTQTITVTGDTPLLQSETSSLGQVVARRTVEELPLNGRNPLALVALVPGVVPQAGFGEAAPSNPFATGNVQINGGAANQSAAYWDGAPLNASGYLNFIALVPSQDALQEFKVQTSSMSAEFDRFSGGIMNFTTKSGTNGVHGVAYEYLRNKVLNANNFFNNKNHVGTPNFTQNQFGGNIGGPVVIPGLYNGTDRTFFFASYDGFRLRRGQPLSLIVPTDAMKAGDFRGIADIYDPATTRPGPTSGTYVRDQVSCNGQLNVICPDKIDPAAKALVDIWGPPNIPGAAVGTVNWQGNASAASNTDQVVARVDHNLSDKHRLFVRYTYSGLNNPAIDVFGTKAHFANQPQEQTAQQAVINDSYSFSATTVGDFALGYLRSTYDVSPLSLDFDLGTLSSGWAALNNQVKTRTLPALAVTGVSAPGASGQAIFEATDDFSFVPNLTLIRGRHTMKVGADLRLARFNYFQANFSSGLFIFSPAQTYASPIVAQGGNGFASYLLGAVAVGWFDMPKAISAQQVYRAVYVQDDIRLTRKLTLNVGLRYNRGGAFTERFDNMTTFLRDAPHPLAQSTGLPLLGRVVAVDSAERSSRSGWDAMNQWAPRIGFGYQLTDKTVIRGGYGVYWLPETAGWGATNPAYDPVNAFSPVMVSSLDGGLTPSNRFGDPMPEGLAEAPGRDPRFEQMLNGIAITTQLPDNPLGYSQQWNFNVQRQMPGGIFLDLAYAGSKGTHLPMVALQLNQLPEQYMSMKTDLNTMVDNPFYGKITSGTLAAPKVTKGQLLLPYPQYTGVTISGAGVGLSKYHAFELKAQKRFEDGGSLLVSYTNSKLISTTGGITNWLEAGVGGVQNWYDRNEQALSSFDVPQRLVVSYVVDLPFGRGQKFLSGANGILGYMISGWGFNGITSIQSGFPLHLSAANLSGSYGGSQRPNYNASAAGCSESAALTGDPTDRLGKWFNTACFVQPVAYTWGNVGRELPNVRSDGIENFDMSLFKMTKFGPSDNLGLQFRAEFFNLFNHAQFGYPGQALNTPATFGVVTSQRNNPRLVQFGLRLTF